MIADTAIREPKMSLGYVKGKYWVADDRYARYTQWETYQKMIVACREAGIMFNCEYSYTAQRYTAEIVSWEKINGSYYQIKHANAFDEHPMLSIVKALRRHPHNSPLLTVLGIEMEVRIIGEKLLPMKLLEDACERLAQTVGQIA